MQDTALKEPYSRSARIAASFSLAIAFIFVLIILISSFGGSGDSAATKKQVSKTYQVRSGDTLSSIAAKKGLDLEVLEMLNPQIDPQVLRPGQKLRLR